MHAFGAMSGLSTLLPAWALGHVDELSVGRAVGITGALCNPPWVVLAGPTGYWPS